jgi:hypothetical protein
MMHNGIPYGYLGLAKNILDEIKKAGFRIRHWEIENNKDPKDKPFVAGELIVHTTKLLFGGILPSKPIQVNKICLA